MMEQILTRRRKGTGLLLFSNQLNEWYIIFSFAASIGKPLVLKTLLEMKANVK